MAIVLIGIHDEDYSDIQSLAEPTVALFDSIQSAIEEDGNPRQVSFIGMLLDRVLKAHVASSASDTLPSAAKILEPGDRYIISRANLTVSNPGFTSKSEHLYHAQQLLER